MKASDKPKWKRKRRIARDTQRYGDTYRVTNTVERRLPGPKMEGWLKQW